MKACPKHSGLTLVELMISIAVFAIVAAGVSSTTMMTSRLAHENIYKNTAYMVAQSYAEQIKSIRYDVIREAFLDPVGHDIPTQSLSLGSGAGVQKMDDPLIFGVPVQKDIVVDIEQRGEETHERIMRMWVTAKGRDLTTNTDCWDSIEIEIEFTWEVAGHAGLQNKDGVVRLVKTNVSEF